jgi:hypothetical protein
MQQCKTSTEITVKRVSVRSGGAGHTHSGVVKECDSKNGGIAVAAANGCPTVSRSTNSIVVRLGT